MSNTSTTTQEPSYIDTVKNENGTSTNDINLDEYSTFFSCVKSVIISLLYSIYLQPSVDAWLTLHKLNLIKK